MSLTEDLPADLVARLQEEAEREGLTLIEHITRVLRARAVGQARAGAVAAGHVNEGGPENGASDAEGPRAQQTTGLQMDADIAEPLTFEQLAEAQRAFLASLDGPFYEAEYVE